MNIDNLSVSTIITLEAYSLDDIKEFEGDWENDDIFFEEIVYNVVAKHVMSAVRNLEPLLCNRIINHISVGVDILGIEPGVAGFYYAFSDVEAGSYGFNIGGYMVNEYLKAYWNKEYELDTNIAFVWEHELTHLLDQHSLEEFKFCNNSTDVREFFMHYLLKYRNEGIAELYPMLKKPETIVNIEMAKERFAKELARINGLAWDDKNGVEEVKKSLLDHTLYYTVGPWMILHILANSETVEIRSCAVAICDKISRSEAIENAEILKLIEYALAINNAQFIRALTKPGLDGKVFVEVEHFRQLTYRLASIEPTAAMENIDNDAAAEYNKVIRFFESAALLDPSLTISTNN